MEQNEGPRILLITDDGAEELHTSHILAKYHFTNRVVKIRKTADALAYFARCNAPDRNPAEPLPELIILSLWKSSGLNPGFANESRRGNLKGIPLVVVAESRQEEEEIKKLGLFRTACISRPIGFFKLLEALQKLHMRWIVLKPAD
jgi:hypothetical protein